MSAPVTGNAVEGRLEAERQAFLELLRMANTLTPPSAIAQQLATLAQHFSCCEAVAIRLKAGPDFPYAASLGFTEGFVALESSLCQEDAEGRLVRDALRNPLLACMCGAVLTQQVDPSQPFFTESGAFWTNATSALLASATPITLPCPVRGRCHTVGFESVGLFPIRRDGVTYGLIQCNDRQPGRFTPERLALLESLCQSAAHLLQLSMA